MNRALVISLPTIVRCLARVTGLASFVFVVAIILAHRPLPNRQPPALALDFLFMAVMTLGLVVAWRWELTGALATLAALVGFNLVELAVDGKAVGGLFPLFALPAALYILDVELRRLAPPPAQVT